MPSVNPNELIVNGTRPTSDIKGIKNANIIKETSVEKALAILDNSLKKTNITVETVCETDRNIDIFTNEIMQVVLNIVKNAQDNFLEKGTSEAKIVIKVYDGPNHQKISITDNGGGIPEEYIESIFNSYFTTKSESEGTGIGLYMSTMIVEDHHQGLLSVYNTEDGACFVIELPFSSSL